MKQNQTYKILLGIASSIFCLGFIILIVDGYYHYNYYHFIEIDRKDLIARLGFLSWTTGFFSYPFIIIFIGLTSIILKRTGKQIVERQWLYLITPAIFIGLLFYTHSIDFILMKDTEFWKLGAILSVASIFTFFVFLKIKQKKLHTKN